MAPRDVIFAEAGAETLASRTTLAPCDLDFAEFSATHVLGDAHLQSYAPRDLAPRTTVVPRDLISSELCAAQVRRAARDVGATHEFGATRPGLRSLSPRASLAPRATLAQRDLISSEFDSAHIIGAARHIYKSYATHDLDAAQDLGVTRPNLLRIWRCARPWCRARLWRHATSFSQRLAPRTYLVPRARFTYYAPHDLCAAQDLGATRPHLLRIWRCALPWCRARPWRRARP